MKNDRFDEDFVLPTRFCPKGQLGEPTNNWHIWLCPTLKPTLRKAKRANSIQPLFKQNVFAKK